MEEQDMAVTQNIPNLTFDTTSLIERGNICAYGGSQRQVLFGKGYWHCCLQQFKVEYLHCESLLETLVALKAQDYSKHQKHLKKICGAASFILDDFLLHTITEGASKLELHNS